MLRFLKKHRKPKAFKTPKTPAPPESATRQITSGVGTEHGRDPEGECRSRQIPTDKADGTDLTMVPGTGHGEGSRIVNQERNENQRLPAPGAPIPTPGHEDGDTSEYTGGYRS